MRPPSTLFARLGSDRIAYQVLGDGPPDLVLTIGSVGHIDLKWDEPVFEDFHRRIATLGRLITFDGRGSGASDPLPPGSRFAWESWVEDLRTVMDAAGSERAVIIGALDAGPTAILFAATHPDRTAALVLINTSARITHADDYPAGLPTEVSTQLISVITENWGTPRMSEILYPDRAGDRRFTEWFAKYQRAAASPRVMADHMDQTFSIDVREVLPLVQAPTLILNRQDNPFVPMAQSTYLAENIQGSRFVELPGSGSGVMGQHVEELAAALREFLTGARGEPDVDRVLATVLFTDIVNSTALAAEVGDRQWRRLLDRHDRTARAEVERYRGRFVKSTGDGLLATFDAPTRALRCAFELAEALAGSGLSIRAGLHTGEIELRGEDVGGIGVHIAARTAAEAGAGQVVVTRTVRDLATGTDLRFTSRGSVGLRGVPDDWELFQAATV
ncbi:MAG: adenylate/guanylate cyclase domain-containing protein [Actinomycetota bacterium]